MAPGCLVQSGGGVDGDDGDDGDDVYAQGIYLHLLVHSRLLMRFLPFFRHGTTILQIYTVVYMKYETNKKVQGKRTSEHDVSD